VDTLAENSDIAIAADNLAFLLILGKLINKPLSLKKIPYCNHKPTAALYLSNFSYYTSFIYGFKVPYMSLISLSTDIYFIILFS
jgi:hypothetical protein